MRKPVAPVIAIAGTRTSNPHRIAVFTATTTAGPPSASAATVELQNAVMVEHARHAGDPVQDADHEASSSRSGG